METVSAPTTGRSLQRNTALYNAARLYGGGGGDDDTPKNVHLSEPALTPKMSDFLSKPCADTAAAAAPAFGATPQPPQSITAAPMIAAANETYSATSTSEYDFLRTPNLNAIAYKNSKQQQHQMENSIMEETCCFSQVTGGTSTLTSTAVRAAASRTA